MNLKIRNRLDFSLKRYPFTRGVPLPQGSFFDPEQLQLNDQNEPLPLQIKVLNRWSDQSLKWVLLDFQVDLKASEEKELCLSLKEPSSKPPSIDKVEITCSEKEVLVQTGGTQFKFDFEKSLFLREVLYANGKSLSINHPGWLLKLQKKKISFFKKNKVLMETEGPLRSTFLVEGMNQGLLLQIRYHFFAGSSQCLVESTLRNPQRAKHPKGIWDLGDRGSVFIEEYALKVDLKNQISSIYATASSKTKAKKIESSSWSLLQNSSGGIAWDSHNHANAQGKVPFQHKGYLIQEDQQTKTGERAEPLLIVSDNSNAIGLAVERFWQNFPKAFKVDSESLEIGLFPQQANDPTELQGGEQKTDRFVLNFSDKKEDELEEELKSFLLPPEVILNAETFLQSGVFGALDSCGKGENRLYTEWLSHMIEGESSFEKRRELIDEYGWRHFGCLVADHEFDGVKGLVSHYNNQYDALKGFIEQYVCSGDGQWWALAEELAQHTIDIDTYHTIQDKSAYNGGYFWHTDHYRDAGLGTHRTYSNHPFVGEKSSAMGGGPSNEHNYTTGLLYSYFLTGKEQAKETVIQLADWVLNMEDGTRTLFRFLDRGDTGLSSRTREADYHGPGRGAANSINAVLDAFILTENKKYLDRLERLIRRCVHPKDLIEQRELNDPERRWSYLVFFQVLGRFLDWKVEQKEFDDLFFYAQASLLHYVSWMIDHEVPYTEVQDKVLIWTETWPAQDIRKADVFAYGAKYGKGVFREKALEKSRLFFKRSLDDLNTFESRYLTRPLVVLMVNGSSHEAFLKKIPELDLPESNNIDWGEPQRFVPQKERAKKKALGIIILVGISLFLLWRFL